MMKHVFKRDCLAQFEFISLAGEHRPKRMITCRSLRIDLGAFRVVGAFIFEQRNGSWCGRSSCCGRTDEIDNVLDGKKERTINVLDGKKERTINVLDGKKERTINVLDGKKERTINVLDGKKDRTINVLDGKKERTNNFAPI